MQYFIEYCLESLKLDYLIENFIQDNKLEDLNYILKINSVCNLFNLQEFKNQKQQTLLHRAYLQNKLDVVQLILSYIPHNESKSSESSLIRNLVFQGN